MARMHFAPMKPTPRGIWRRVPPLIFLPLAGLGELALGWETATALLALPTGLAGLLSGAVVAMTLLALIAYGSKLVRRPAVIGEELAILPGQAGLAAGVLSLYLVAALIGLRLPLVGKALLIGGLILHVGLVVVRLRVWRAAAPEQRRVTPVWQLGFAGLVVAAQAALVLGWAGLAEGLFWPSLLGAVVIYALSARQLRAERVPPPLRPLLALHLVPVALLGTVAAGLGFSALAWGLGVIALLLLLIVGIVAGRWLLEAGPSLFLGALALPLAAVATLWLGLLGMGGGGWVQAVAAVLLVLATLVDLPITFLVWRDWARGRLAVKSNAATA